MGIGTHSTTLTCLSRFAVVSQVCRRYVVGVSQVCRRNPRVRPYLYIKLTLADYCLKSLREIFRRILCLFHFNHQKKFGIKMT